MGKYSNNPSNNGDNSRNVNLSPVLTEDAGLLTCTVKADPDISQTGYLEVLGRYSYNHNIDWGISRD